MILLYLTFGTDLAVHQQAAFSAMTFLARGAGEVEVLTDAPEFYGGLSEKIRLRTITPAQLEEWKGAHGFFWRIKIKALEELALVHPGNDLLYLDADTFCFSVPQWLTRQLHAGTHLMHAREGIPSHLPTSTERTMGRQTVGKTFGGVTIRPDHEMYNAGVVALSAGRALEAVHLALAICDDMCAAGVTRRLVEQLALSVALRESGGIGAANAVIGHYWGNKADWNGRIARHFTTHFLRGSSLEEQIAATRGVDFREFPVYRKSSSTQKKFHRWIAGKIDGMPVTFTPDPGTDVSDRSERWLAERVTGRK